jgi:hypothetical protein
MALEFSSPLDCRGYADNHNDDHLPHLPRVSHDAYFIHNISNPCSTIHLIPPLTVTTLNPCSIHASYPFMETRRMAPMCPWGNQGGLI